MSKKLTFTAIVFLLVGSIIIPTGIVADQYIGDLVSANLDTGLNGIRDEAGPIVENMVNITFSANIIILAVQYCKDLQNGTETFFNDITEAANITYDESFQLVALLCPSFYYGENLGFTPKAQEILINGSGTKGNSDYVPGICNDTRYNEKNAWDAIDFLENYDNAVANPSLKLKMENDYNCTWNQLTLFVNYIRIHIFLERIPDVLASGKHLLIRPELSEVDYTISAIAYYYFLIQWANAELVGNPGFPLPLGFMDAYGLEAGIPIPLNLTYQEAKVLWNETNEYALTNALGMERWKAARDNPDSNMVNYLMFKFGLSEAQMTIILNWLYDFEHELMPYLAQYLYGLPADTNFLANLLGIGGIILGGALIGLSTIGILGSTVSKKPSKISISKKVSNHVFLSGLNQSNKYADYDNDQENELYEDSEDDQYE